MSANHLPPAEIDRISKLYGLPEFWKEAEAYADFDGPLSDREYADGFGRQYPIHTKSATWLSTILFWETAIAQEAKQADSCDPELAAALVKAADFWGITDAVQERVIRPLHTKSAAESNGPADEDFALVKQAATGTVRAYPIVDAQVLAKSASAWFSDRPRMPLEWRSDSARQILKAAAELKVAFTEPVTDALERSAGLGIEHPAKIAEAFYARARLLDSRKTAAESLELVAAGDEFAAVEAPTAELCWKAAQALDALDARHGWHAKYADTRFELLAIPEDVCCRILPSTVRKEASAFFRLPTGSVYRKDDLRKVAGLLTAAMGDLQDQMQTGGEFDKEATAVCLSTIGRERVGTVERIFAIQGVERQNVPAFVFSC